MPEPTIGTSSQNDPAAAAVRSSTPPTGPSPRPVHLLLAAALYLAAAWAGHQLAIATDYASPFWPAAGLALASLVVWGLRCWPAIWIAGALTDLVIRGGEAKLLVTVGIASGIALQAVCGAWLVLRYLRGDGGSYSDRGLAAFILQAGPATALIGCSIGILSQLAGGTTGTAQALDEWLTWWAGDSIGVLLFAPVALALWPSAEALRKRWEGGWQMAVTPLVTAVLLIGGLVYMTRFENARVHAEALQNMDVINDRGLLELSGAVEPLHGVVRFFEASEEVTREEFRLYAGQLHHHPAVIATDWAPRVADADREDFIRVARADGFPDYTIFDFDESGRTWPSPQRTDYFPVLYSEPLEANRIAIGLDHGEAPERRAAMARALENPGSPHIARTELLRSDVPSILVFLPVMERATSTLTGYVVGVLDLQALLSRVIGNAERQDIAFRVWDISPGAEPSMLLDRLPPETTADSVREIAFGGMAWRLEMKHTGRPRDSAGTNAVRVYLAFAVLAALLVAFAVLGSSGRNAATNARVSERTRELARALGRLKNREAEERAVLDNIVECVITIDHDGTVLNVNRAVEQMFGYPPDEIIGRNVSLLMPEHEAGAHDRHIQRYLATGERRVIGRNREVEGRHKDGHTISLELAVSEYVFGDRRLFTGTLRDISERKSLVEDLTRARQHADEANRAKSAFLAAMSHEIRTPMNGVVGLVDVLARSSLDEYQRDLVRTIRESSTTLLTLIDDILDFSKIEAGRLEIERRPVQLAELIEGVCSSLSPIAVRRGVDVSLHIDPRLPPIVISDEVRLRQILFNILGNAIKFSAGRPDVRGAVSVRVRIAAEAPLRIAFTVADNGIGIAPERLSDLFRPFTQAESSTTRRFGGTGLGLAICRRLVDMMDGTITVDSAVGRGSTFNVSLPFEAGEAEDTLPQPDLRDLPCLIAPCCGEEGDTLADYLAHAGAQVVRPDDGAQALDFALGAATTVVVIECARNGVSPTTRLPLPGADVRIVRLVRGRAGASRSERDDMVVIDGNVLRRQVLLRAVAVAAGRASPEDVSAAAGDELEHSDLAPPTLAEARAQGRLILVAEDNEINQKVILHQLALLGYAAQVADDGAQALQLWRHGDYGLLLTDLHMPVMDGYALTEAIRAAEGADTRKPILALTANALRGEERRALDAGMDAYLTKPVQLEELRRTLERFLPAPAGASASTATPPEAAPAPAREADATRPVFDVSVLEELVGDDQEIVREFLEEFRRSALDLADAMRTALAGGWTSEAGNAAHKLKSAARSVGALALGELCASIEQVAREDRCDALTQQLPAFDALLHDTAERIGEFLETHRHP